MRSLTRAEAKRRADLLTVDSYNVALDLPSDGEVFGSVTTVRFAVADPSEATFIEVVPASLRSVRLNGAELDLAEAYSAAEGRICLGGGAGLAAQNELVVDALMPYTHDGEGVHRHVDPADGRVYLYANSSITAGPRWFACFDQPDLKASMRLSISCPPGWTVAGNGPAAQLEPGRWQLASTGRFATYLAAFVAGPYHSVSASHDGIPLALHARASLAPHLDRDADELLAHTGACLDEFHRLFGIRYPWGEYHQAFVPEFNWGAMENPGCVTFRDPLVFRTRVTDSDHCRRASVIAHEMAHMWFGDLVTMRWWDDIWLNESFAEYLGQRVTSAVIGRSTWIDFGAKRKSWGYAADRRPTTHPVAGNGVTDAASALNDFDGISYAKGASVLRQLAAHLGDELFFAGLRAYFATHAYGNAQFADLIGAWTAAGARGLDDWAEAWLRTSGVDTLQVSRAGGSACIVRSAARGRPHALTVAAYDGAGVELSRVAVGVAADRTELPGLPPSAALVLANADDGSWARTALSAAEWQAMPHLLPRLDPAARVVVWNSLRLAVADAELAPSLALDIAVAALAVEDDDAILSSGARWTSQLLLGDYLAADPARERGEQRLATALDAARAGAAPGSGLELAAVRGWIDVVTAAPLQHWRDGGDHGGLALDTELRWQLLQRLAALGELTGDEIDREAAADQSTQGAVHAAKCRALQPSAEAKAAAWTALMGDAQQSNYELYAIAAGFWHPRHRQLTEPYVARYFAEIAATATLRSGIVVERVASDTFPRTASAPDALELAEQLLQTPDLHEGIRHCVIDGADDLRRALAARAAFGD